jgi:hypothetical protein
MKRLAVVALMAALSLTGAEAASATQLGFTDDAAKVARAAPAVRGTSEIARIPVKWSGIQAEGWGWEWLDSAVNAGRSSGQSVMLTVYGAEAPNLADWQSFLRQLQARYPDLWAVQAWNEPNLANIGGGLSVEQTVAIVNAAREALPGVRLIGPGVSPTVPGADQYQTELYRALPNDIGVAVNIYTYRDERLVPDVRQEYRAAKADGGEAEVYVTEFGFHAAYFANQAQASAKGFKALRRKGAAAVIFYRLLSNPLSQSNWERTGNFAVLNDDLSSTPVLDALRTASRTPQLITKRGAVARSKRALRKRFGRRYVRGVDKRNRCVLKATQKYRCKVRWVYAGTLFKGTTIVPGVEGDSTRVRVNIRKHQLRS